MARLPDPTSSLSSQGQALSQQLVARRGQIDGMYRSLLNTRSSPARSATWAPFCGSGPGPCLMLCGNS